MATALASTKTNLPSSLALCGKTEERRRIPEDSQNSGLCSESVVARISISHMIQTLVIELDTGILWTYDSNDGLRILP
jgi:hypothetical protein